MFFSKVFPSHAQPEQQIEYTINEILLVFSCLVVGIFFDVLLKCVCEIKINSHENTCES